jgi:hypothetical protein
MIRSLACILAVCALVAVAPVTALADLLIEPNVSSFDGMTSDRFTWIDASGQPRVAVLAHNTGQVGPGGTRGGELREYRYQLPGPLTRIVRASGNAFSGFGYVVSHPNSLANCVGGDSDLGHSFPGTLTRVFQGRHHAIFRFQQNYPRNCPDTPPGQTFNVPVTIDWVFATGRNHPLWALTWDLSGVPVDKLMDDSRAPYGELLFDGAASEGAHSTIAGVGWDDGRTFVTTSSPVTYNSSWTWNGPSRAPNVRLWTTAVDATMGTVLTQTKAQQDAGGYFGASRWDTTSAVGNACDSNVDPDHDGVHLMPCDFNWPYQSINFSLDPSTPNNSTNNTRLAWGTNFGFLGQSQYVVHGSAFFGGPDPTTFASGHPRKSYSTFIVLDRHSVDPVGAQVTQIQRVQTTVLTASIGTVKTSGPAGVNRPDNVTYAPAGWNHVYAAWALTAAGSQIDANFNVGVGTLTNPVIIVSNWTTGLPSTVRFKGVTLTQDVGYFPSLRGSAQELWITLNQNVSGATNRLEIMPGPPVTAGGSGLVADFDGDRISDVAVYRGTTAEWLIRRSTDAGLTQVAWGSPFLLDVPVPGDYDGDGISDIGVYRRVTAEWLIRRSTDGALFQLAWGSPFLDDVPVPGDYDGDGKTDIAVFRRSAAVWYIRMSSTGGLVVVPWGSPFLLDAPVLGDFDGDGTADVAIYRRLTAEWLIRRSTDGALFQLAWGSPFLDDVPVPGDYDGDGKTDIAVYRRSTAEWLIRLSASGALFQIGWGSPFLLDVPVPGDYDGDGKIDVAIYRRSTGVWYIRLSSNGTLFQVAWGSPPLGDLPVTVPLHLLLYP